MTTITIDEAAVDLKRLIHEAEPGEEIVLTENDRPVARILPVQKRRPIVFGTGKDDILYMSDDFDAPLEEFAEYM